MPISRNKTSASPRGPAGGGGVGAGGLHKHVLGKFNHAERERLPALLAHAGECLRVYLFRGLQAASEVTNGKNAFAQRQEGKGQGKGKAPSQRQQQQE